MWSWIKSIFNFPIIDWDTDPVLDEAGTLLSPAEDIFTFTLGNILLIVIIYLVAKLFIKYTKRYFKALHLDEKQLRIEGKEIAIWKLFKQLVYLVTFYFCFLSLKISNPHLDLGHLMAYRFASLPNTNFHIAVYHIFLATALIFISRVSVNFLKVFVLKSIRRNDNIDKGTEYIYIQLAKYLVYTIAMVILLRSLGMNLDLFLTATTFLLVAVGLGLQGIFQDYFSGILLLVEGTIKVGDILEIENMKDSDNFVAKIIQINLRTSRVETRDEKVLVIPNSKLTQENVNNWSVGTPLTRFTIPVTVHYGADTELVQKLLIECAEAHPKVSRKNKPIVRLLHFGNYGLEMDLVFWADQTLLIEILKSDLRFAIDKAFRANNIEIPYPQNDVHFKSPQTQREEDWKKEGFDQDDIA